MSLLILGRKTSVPERGTTQRLSFLLTFWAKVGAALGHHGFYYNRFASRAGLALAVKDVERFRVVAVLAVGADEVTLSMAEACSGIGDAFFQNGLNSVPEGFRFVKR